MTDKGYKSLTEQKEAEDKILNSGLGKKVAKAFLESYSENAGSQRFAAKESGFPEIYYLISRNKDDPKICMILGEGAQTYHDEMMMGIQDFIKIGLVYDEEQRFTKTSGNKIEFPKQYEAYIALRGAYSDMEESPALKQGFRDKRLGDLTNKLYASVKEKLK